LAGHIRVLAAVIFRIVQVAISHEICQKNRVIESVLIYPFSKIIPIWAYFKTEPDTGFFSRGQGVIGGQIEPGLDTLVGHHSPRIHVLAVKHGFKSGNPKCQRSLPLKAIAVGNPLTHFTGFYFPAGTIPKIFS
jgi:hypothetical protein